MTSSFTKRSQGLARTLGALALFAAGVQSACISLAGSTACPSYAKYQVDTSAAQNVVDWGMGINMAQFTDVKTFDAAVLNATGFLTSASTCTGYNSTQRIRYQDTLLCVILAQDSASMACTADAPNMCGTSCTLYADAMSAMITKTCPTDSTSTKQLTSLKKICSGEDNSLPGLHDNMPSCVNATTNEATSCGFGSQTAMCSFCATNTTDTCCISGAGAVCSTPTSTLITPTGATTITGMVPPSATPSSNDSTQKSGLSTSTLAAIIGGAVAALLIFFALIVCCIRRRSRATKPAKGGSRNLARNVSTSSASKYNISAPKIQEEGFSSALTPSAPIPMTALPMISTTDTSLGAGATAAAAAAAVNRISKQSSVSGNGKQSYCQVLYPYQASMADELDLTPGDLVNVHRVFDDGWAVGVNMNTSNEGAFPVVCVMFVDESALDDDFEDVNMHSMTPMGHREDDMQSKGSPRSSVMPSRSSSPVHLPRRHSSMIRDSAVLPGLNGPMTSSPLAGGNNVAQQGRLQPPAMRDTMMSDASSINRWWEGEGSAK